MLNYRISPSMYGSRAAAIDGITSAEIRIGPEQFRDGMIVVPSAARSEGGRPRFEVLVPIAASRDVSALLLMAYEQEYYGFEAPYRLFLQRHIEPGDVFIDVGAHWGVYAVDVATRALPEVAILACEPAPGNVEVLRMTLRANGVENRVEVIPRAIADFEGRGAMVPGISMRWQLAPRNVVASESAKPLQPVEVVTIDAILRDRPALHGRRIFLKVDVEGGELAVLQGARGLLDSGRVAAIIVEYHPRRSDPGELGAMIGTLRHRGYRLARFPHHHMGGALIDFAPDDTVCNLIAIHPALHPAAAYTAEYRGFAPLPAAVAYQDMDPTERERREAILREWRAPDGARWSDPRNFSGGAESRALLAAAHLRAGDSVLDLGTGAGMQRRVLPPGCSYVSVDLIQRDADTLVADLNRTTPGAPQVQHVIASRILEHLYDPAPLLRWCAARALRLTCIHAADVRPAYDPDNVASEPRLAAMLSEGGWRILECARHGDDLVFRCGSP